MTEKPLGTLLDESTAVLCDRLQGRAPEVGIVLGSGLGPLAEQVENPLVIPFGEVPHMRCSTATGHAGRFVVGELCGKQVMVMQGRLHGYEGCSPEEIAYPVWLMARAGVKTLIVTNAAGAINETYRVGDFCLMSDHINFMGHHALAHPRTAKLGRRFFSMTDAYDPELRRLARQVAAEYDIRVHEGVYLGLCGPTFETPAEIRAFRAWGADTVAMSAIDEVYAARQQGVRVLGVSLISNMAAGVGATMGEGGAAEGGASPTGQEVFDAARAAESNFCALVSGVIERL